MTKRISQAKIKRFAKQMKQGRWPRAKRKPASPKPEQTTHIVMVVDESGSMASKVTDTIGSFNTFLADQKKIKGQCFLSLVKFHTDDTPVHTRLPLAQVPELNHNTYGPAGGTALLDALGRAINAASADKDVIVCVITDGEENSSKSFTLPQIKAMVESKTAAGWNFVFLGAGLDAFGAAASMGFTRNLTVQAHNTAVGLAASIDTVTYATTKFRSGDKSMLDNELVSNYVSNHTVRESGKTP